MLVGVVLVILPKLDIDAVVIAVVVHAKAVLCVHSGTDTVHPVIIVSGHRQREKAGFLGTEAQRDLLCITLGLIPQVDVCSVLHDAVVDVKRLGRVAVGYEERPCVSGYDVPFFVVGRPVVVVLYNVGTLAVLGYVEESA